MNVDPQRLKALFVSAAEISSPTERAALLERECGNDAELRRRLDVLLHAHDDSGGFLASVPTVDPAPARDDGALGGGEAAGSVIGPYKLLQQIGEGGMGVVFLAEQTKPVQRKVALKILKPGMDSRQVIARFEAERQALALMDHPNIARVFDAGCTATGRPYFVMELVKGTPITTYCDEHRLPLPSRLELFVSVCQAIQHAHQKGIIHRDIKPSNVLVAPYDGRPVIKVIDFGIAKATGPKLTERTLFTEFGAVVGTLQYMSPEQAELNNLDIDTRSDIYSLGVLLYELLTGTTPLDMKQLQGVAFAAILQRIQEQEPPRPSVRLSESKESLPSISAQRQTEPARLPRLVRGELDWIVMKALEKDRGRRYETANGLARDLGRHLAGEVVEACPPSVLYRLNKFLRRNPGCVGGTALLLLVLLVGFVTYTFATSAARMDSYRKEWAEEDRVRAGSHLVLLHTGLIFDYFLSALNDPEGPPPDKDGPRVRTVLDRLSKTLQARDSGQETPSDAILHVLLAESYTTLGDSPAAEKHLRKACALLDRQRGEEHYDTRSCRCALARACAAQGQYQEAEQILHEVMQGGSMLRGEALDPVFGIWIHYHEQSIPIQLASLYEAQRKYAEAEAVYEKELRLQDAEPAKDHDHLLALLGNVRLKQKKFTAAEEPLRACLALRQRQKADDWLTFNAQSMLGASLLGQKKYAQAEPLLLAGYQGLKQRQNKIPLQSRFRLREALERLVQLYEATGDKDAAAKWRKELEEVKPSAPKKGVKP
jgi:serine/threonine protein kinase/tetratricopeptide (TPR) repeat protein